MMAIDIAEMTNLLLFWIFLWGSALVLCCLSAMAGAEDRVKKDEKYSFRKLYEDRDQQTV
jgi:hypothetical protein